MSRNGCHPLLSLSLCISRAHVSSATYAPRAAMASHEAMRQSIRPTTKRLGPHSPAISKVSKDGIFADLGASREHGAVRRVAKSQASRTPCRGEFAGGVGGVLRPDVGRQMGATSGKYSSDMLWVCDQEHGWGPCFRRGPRGSRGQLPRRHRSPAPGSGSKVYEP